MGTAIILALEGIMDELLQILFEFVHSPGAAKGLVIAEKGKNDICFGPFEPIIRASEVFAPHTHAQFVAGETEIPNGQMAVREMGLDKSFEPAVVLQAIRKRVANDRDVVAVVEGERIGGGFRRIHERQQKTSSKKEFHCGDIMR